GASSESAATVCSAWRISPGSDPGISSESEAGRRGSDPGVSPFALLARMAAIRRRGVCGQRIARFALEWPVSPGHFGLQPGGIMSVSRRSFVGGLAAALGYLGTGPE